MAGWTGGVPGAQMCVRACERRVSVVDVRVSVLMRVVSERLLGVINIICPRTVERELSKPVPNIYFTLASGGRRL